jgi:hypothetical protein
MGRRSGDARCLEVSLGDFLQDHLETLYLICLQTPILLTPAIVSDLSAREDQRKFIALLGGVSVARPVAQSAGSRARQAYRRADDVLRERPVGRLELQYSGRISGTQLLDGEIQWTRARGSGAGYFGRTAVLFFFVFITTTSHDFFPQVTVEQFTRPHQLQPPALLALLPLQMLAAWVLLTDVEKASPEASVRAAQAIIIQSTRTRELQKNAVHSSKRIILTQRRCSNGRVLSALFWLIARQCSRVLLAATPLQKTCLAGTSSGDLR